MIMGGSFGFRCTLSAAPLRTQSMAELVRKTWTSNPLLMPPLAMLQATEARSLSNPSVMTITSFLDDMVLLFLVYRVQITPASIGGICSKVQRML